VCDREAVTDQPISVVEVIIKHDQWSIECFSMLRQFRFVN
jgi:hypothetical protein